MRVSLCYELISSAERNKQTSRDRNTQCIHNSDPITSTSELLLRQNSITAHAHQSQARRFESDHCATENHRPKSAVGPIYATENKQGTLTVSAVRPIYATENHCPKSAVRPIYATENHCPKSAVRPIYAIENKQGTLTVCAVRPIYATENHRPKSAVRPIYATENKQGTLAVETEELGAQCGEATQLVEQFIWVEMRSDAIAKER
jgi:stringent starvation protein B